MNINKILAEAEEQRRRLDLFIEAGRLYAAGSTKRRGRPPNWMSKHRGPGRPPGSKNKPKAEEAA